MQYDKGDPAISVGQTMPKITPGQSQMPQSAESNRHVVRAIEQSPMKPTFQLAEQVNVLYNRILKEDQSISLWDTVSAAIASTR